MSVHTYAPTDAEMSARARENLPGDCDGLTKAINELRDVTLDVVEEWLWGDHSGCPEGAG